MESTLRRRNGRTASAISVASASQRPAALGLDMGPPFSLDGPADASLASWSRPASDPSATLATSLTSSSIPSSSVRAVPLPRTEAQVTPVRVVDGARSTFASSHASSSSSAFASTSSIPRPLASMPVPRRRIQTTPSSSSAPASAAASPRERTTSQPIAGQTVPRLELSPHSLASFKRSFRENSESANDNSGPIASGSTLQSSSSPSESATTSSSSRLDFAFLDASASSVMTSSSSGTSPEVGSPESSSLQSLPPLDSQPSSLSIGSSLYGGSSSIPRHSPPTPSGHTRVKRRRSGSRTSGILSRPPSALPRLIGRSRRNTVTSAPEILERNAQADMSQRSGEDARFLDTPAPGVSSLSAIPSRTSAVHPSISARVELLSQTIRPPLLSQVGLGVSDATFSARMTSEEGTANATSSSTSASHQSSTGLIHMRPRRLAHSDTYEGFPPLPSLPLERSQWQALPPLPPLPGLRAGPFGSHTLEPTSPVSVRSRRGNALPLELGELPSFDIDWNQIRFGEGASFDSQSADRRTNSQPQRPNLHRNATAVTPPEESPLTTPDGDISVMRPAETYRTFFRSDRDGDIIMEGQDDEENIVLPSAHSDISVEDTAFPDEDEVLGDNDYDGFSDGASIASSSSWLRTIVGEAEVASNAGDFASVSPTSSEHQRQVASPSVDAATPYGSAVESIAAEAVPSQLNLPRGEEAVWNLSSEFQRAERLSQLIERRRSIATEVASYQTRHDTSTQESLDRIERYSEDTRARLRSLRAQINRDRDAFLEPFEWQLTSDDEEVTSATSRQANVSTGARSRGRLWGEIQTEQPLSRNLLTSPVGLPRPSLSVSTATTSGLRSSGQAALRRRPGSLGSGSMRGPTRSSNEAWLRNQGIDLHESLSLPSLQQGSGHPSISAEDEDDISAANYSPDGVPNNWSRGSSSAARALRRIAARLPADSASFEERQGNSVTATDLLRQFRDTAGDETHLSLPALRYPRPLAVRRSAFSQSDAGPQLPVDFPSISPLSNLLPLPPVDAVFPQSAIAPRNADGDSLNNTSSANNAQSDGDDSANFWTNITGTNMEAPGVPGRFRSWGPANLASAQAAPTSTSPPSFQAPVSHFARSRLLDRLRDQSSRPNMQIDAPDIARTSHRYRDRGADIIERPAGSDLRSSGPASLRHESRESSQEAQPQGNLGQARRSLDTIRRILDDLETGTPRNRTNGSEDPSSSDTSTLLSPPERSSAPRLDLPELTSSAARPSRVSPPSHAGTGWQPGSGRLRMPPLPELPSLNLPSNTTARTSRPRTMLQPFDEIYAEVEAEFAGRDRVRERLPRRRSAFMQEILAELEQRRSSPSAQAAQAGNSEPRVSRNPDVSGSSPATHTHSQTLASEDGQDHRRASRDRLLERLSTFTRGQAPLPPRPSGAVSGWTERSTESSFARRWDSLLSEDEEDRVPLPPFMWRSLRTSATLGGIASESANYVSDSELDTSYEGLLALSDRIGSARPRGATATALREGLERSTFTSHPPLSINTIHVAAADREVRCGICLEDYGEGDILAKSKKCGHALHSVCFETWLKRVDTCPICRQAAV